MKLIQFLLLGVCLSMLFSSVGATTVYFGHLATRVGVDVGGEEIEDLQTLIDHNQFSAPAANGCRPNQCISFYTNENFVAVPTCIDILHFNKTGNSTPPLLKHMVAPTRSDISAVVEPQLEYNLSELPLPVLSAEPIGLPGIVAPLVVGSTSDAITLSAPPGSCPACNFCDVDVPSCDINNERLEEFDSGRPQNYNQCKTRATNYVQTACETKFPDETITVTWGTETFDERTPLTGILTKT